MRLFLFTIFLSSFAFSNAHADQTDPRLDHLFEELRTGDALSADETIDRIIGIWSDAQSDTVDLLYARAASSFANDQLDLAATLVNHVVGLAPNFAEGYALRAVIRMQSQNQAGAIADYSKVLELEPRHFGVRLALADFFLANGDKREAYDMFQKALEWNPHDERVRRQARALRRELDGQEI